MNESIEMKYIDRCNILTRLWKYKFNNTNLQLIDIREFNKDCNLFKVNKLDVFKFIKN